MAKEKLIKLMSLANELQDQTKKDFWITLFAEALKDAP